MVTKRDGMRKETWCASSTKNRDTLNMIVLSTKNKDKRRKKIWCVSNAKNRDTLNMIVLYTKMKPIE